MSSIAAIIVYTVMQTIPGPGNCYAASELANAFFLSFFMSISKEHQKPFAFHLMDDYLPLSGCIKVAADILICLQDLESSEYSRSHKR